MEILLAMAIAGLLMAPLGAWAYSTLKSGIISRDELGRANATGLLNVYFLKDVASSRAFVSQYVPDCAGAPSTPATRPVLRVTQSGDAAQTVVYAVGTGADPVPLYRRVCSPSGTFVSSNKVMGRVIGSSVSASCASADGTPIGCDMPGASRASMVVRPWSAQGVKPPITVSGTRRTTGIGGGFSNSNPPDPRLDIGPSISGYNDTTFTAINRSTDPDGDPMTVTWTLPAGASVTAGSVSSNSVSFRLPQRGEVVLTVSDGSNVVASSVFIDIINRPPVIQSVSPCTQGAGRNMSLAATAADPDGDAVTVRWVDPLGNVVVGNPATWTAPAELSGEQNLELNVTDGKGGVTQQAVRCSVGGASVGGGVDITYKDDTNAVRPMPANGVINSVQPSGGLPVTFTAQDPGSSTISWELFRKGGTTAVNSKANATEWSDLVFSYAEAGEYEILRYTDGVAGPRVGFRVNARPSVTLTSPSAAGVVPNRFVDFVSIANDPDGTIVTTTWDFGDGTGVVSAPPGAVTHTYTTPGDKTVTFTATDNYGATGTVSLRINVPEKPVSGG